MSHIYLFELNKKCNMQLLHMDLIELLPIINLYIYIYIYNTFVHISYFGLCFKTSVGLYKVHHKTNFYMYFHLISNPKKNHQM